MTNRTVEVKLRLVTDQYKREAEESAHATERLDDKVQAVERDLKKLPKDAAEAAAAMKLLGSESTAAGERIKGVGENSNALKVLDTRIVEARAEVKKLGDEFVRTGSIDVWKKLGDADVVLRHLEGFRKQIVKVAGEAGDEGGRGFIRRFTDLLGRGSNSMMQGLANIPWVGVIFKPLANAIQAMPPEAQLAIGAAIAGAIAASAAAIGAAINGVLTAGVGLGGIALGIVGQIHNPLVRDAWTLLGHQVMAELGQISASFTAPLAYGARVFLASWHEIMPHLRADFEWLSKFIYPLSAGLGGLFTNMMPGLDKAFAAAGPMLQEFANQLPGLGRALSDFFSSLSAGQTGAVEGLRTLFLVIDQVIRHVGTLIHVLSDMYEGMVAANEAVSGFAAKILGWYPVLGGYIERVHSFWANVKDGADNASGGAETFAMSLQTLQDQLDDANKLLNATAVTLDSLAGAMTKKVFDATMGVDEATLKWHESLTKLGDALRSNKDALDIHTKAGQDDRQAVLAAVTANMELYQRMLAAGASATDAAAAYDANTAALDRQLRKAGLTQQQIDGLIGKYRGIPDTVNTTLAIQGLTDAINGLADLIRLLNGIPTTKHIDVMYRVQGSVDAHGNLHRPGEQLNARGGIRYAATGLIIPPSRGGTVIAAEAQTGGEALIPLRGISQARALDLTRVVAGAYGLDVTPRGRGRVAGPVYNIVVNAGVGADGAAVGAKIVNLIKQFERGNGSGWRSRL